jgi:choline dehydrogenase-like flavoprotein
LAQTLAEDGNLKTLLIERGDERSQATENVLTADEALLDECSERHIADGVVVATGNCMGGATAINQGIMIQEDPNYLISIMDPNSTNPGLFNFNEIDAAYTWVRNRVMFPTNETGGAAEYMKMHLTALGSLGFTMHETDTPGRAYMYNEGVWRAYSIFHPETGERYASDTFLDRTNPNLFVATRTTGHKILFDGDPDIPAAYVVNTDSQTQQNMSSDQQQLPTARCVRTIRRGEYNLITYPIYCVKPGGRIFVSGGAIHTPMILMRSGVGQNGTVVNNDKVGQNLSDKPMMVLMTNFPKDFPTLGQVIINHMTATRTAMVQGIQKVFLWEQFILGVERGVQNFVRFHQNFFPRELRGTPIAQAGMAKLDLCRQQYDANLSLPLIDVACFDIFACMDAGCDSNVAGTSPIVSNPTSRGSVTFGENEMTPVIKVNWLQTPDDMEVFGASIQTAYQIVRNYAGPAAPQRPCDDPAAPANQTCPSCPDLLQRMFGLIRLQTTLVSPGQANLIPVAPGSVVAPATIEEVMKTTSDPMEVGKAMQDEIFAAHHFTGTACFGNVIDKTFKVIGTNGLYVADASVLPNQSRMNPMATIMMIGRLVGVNTLRELAAAAQ